MPGERRYREIQRDFSRPNQQYATALEKLALNKLSNNEVFEHMKNSFDEELNYSEFKLMNFEKNIREDFVKVGFLGYCSLWDLK